MKNVKPQHPDALKAEFIDPIAAHCHRTPGALAELVRQMNEMSGVTWHRQQIETYLQAEPAKRIEPRLGMGLLLRKAFESLNGKDGK